MLPYMTKIYGNAASRNHQFGWEAEQGVEKAREQIAKLIGATPKEIIFTSGATEGNNLAIKGVAEMYREKGNHIITQVTEHKAVLDTCKRLEKNGYKVTYLPVQPDGLVSVADIEAAMTPETILVTIMYANNEIGVINPIARSASSATRRACSSTRTPCRLWARSRSTCRRTTSTCCRFPATRSTAPRAWARCMFAAATRACSSTRRSTAAATSAACVRAR